ncbi:dof zinc finger protein 4-like [Zingiber officinale]|uniref:Dof zinc finger protein n=1 Tax=Zingiber officinale TaxID=94328 RepID=A0A8J5G5J2_ZINOF|nr:dof zinc finger protein 4-like [Zingiber officinale]KAG6500835.1 hypothetical protein ZIOFF_040692 [Zingiber officinale]
MAFPSFPTIHLHPHNRKQQHPNYRAAGGDGIGGPSGPAPRTKPVGLTAGRSSREAKLVGRPPEQEVIKCPRCDSTNTKFCYFNNYSLSQPRHYCKACRRYWTRGGALREVPVGGGRRKNKRRTEKPELLEASAGGGTAGTSSFEPNYPLASSIIHQYRSSGPPPAINMPSPASWIDPLPDRSSTINIDPYATNPANYYEVSATGSPNNNLGFEINNYLKLRQQFPFTLGEELLLPPPPEVLQPFGEPVKIDRGVKARQLGNRVIIPRHVSNLSPFDRSSADGFIDWSGSGNSSAGGGGWPAATSGGDFTTMRCFSTPPTDRN